MTIPEDATIPPYLIAILIAAVVSLAGVVAYLFKHFSTKQSEAEAERRLQEKESAKERLGWALERQKLDTTREEYETALRLEYETKHRIVLENHIKVMTELHEASREHEDLVRREFAQNMEMVASKAMEASDKVAAVLDKFYDRFVGPRSRVKGQ
jgi:hypothetical protein